MVVSTKIGIQGSCQILFNNETSKKIIKFINGTSWNKNVKYDKSLNGHFIVPNEDYTVIDIDDPNTEQNKHIIEEFMPDCNYIVKTRKGYHLYYEFEPKIEDINKIHAVDIIHKGRKMLFVPPSSYDMNGETIEYKFIKNNKPNKMPNELINFIKDRYNNRKNETTTLLKDSEKIVKRLTSKAEPKRIVSEYKAHKKTDEIIVQLLEALADYRCDDYDEWFKILMILKNEGFNYELFEHFSKRSQKFDNNVKNIWDDYNPKNVKNQITVASLWAMVKSDNPKKFVQIKLMDAFKDYEKKEFEKGTFLTKKFIELWNEDIDIFNNKILDPECLSLTNSFKYFDMHHAKITNLGYVRLTYKGQQRDILPLSSTFLNSINEANMVNGDKKYYFMDLYDENPHKQIYEKIAFEPLTQDPSILNYFNGFCYDVSGVDFNKNNIIDYLNFIKHVINNDKLAEHFIDWITHIIQKPNIKQTTVYVFYSYKHGIGKNTLLQPIMNIMKGYYYTVNNINQLSGQFNSESLGKLLCVADEIKTFKQGENLCNIIKNFATQTERSIEFKGKDKITNIKDYCNMVCTTNNEYNFYIEQSDRRFTLVECNKKLLPEETYAKMVELARDENFLKQLYYFFSTRKISETYKPNKPFITEYKERIQKKSLPADIKILANKRKELIGKFYTNKELIQFIKCYNDKKSRSSAVIITSMTEDYGFKQSRPYDDNGNRLSTYGFSFDDDDKTGKINIQALKNLCDDDDDDIDNMNANCDDDE